MTPLKKTRFIVLLMVQYIKVTCLIPMVVVSLLPHAEFGRNEYRENALQFMKWTVFVSSPDSERFKPRVMTFGATDFQYMACHQHPNFVTNVPTADLI